ncbi:hypothetical protein [Tenacibaculum piscium]|uniref:hypothetical protein n=1 Tax=Tenacibaculum piscium TaxID=1458515 RepID=UPI001F36B1C8|nr:hypothetical protein [Tenacibaculum piscium]
MEEEKTLLSKSMTYEIYAKNGFQKGRQSQRISNKDFLNLVDAENGKKSSLLGSFEKQMNEIIQNLKKATQSLIKDPKNETILEPLNDLLNDIDYVNSSENIHFICLKGNSLLKK